MACPTGEPILSYVNAETTELILRVVHLFLVDGLSVHEESDLSDDAVELATRCKDALLLSPRDTNSHHRLVFMTVWAFAHLVTNPSDELAGQIASAAGMPVVDEAHLQTLEQRCILAWLNEHDFHIQSTRPPCRPQEHQRVRAILAMGLESLLKPDPITIFHRSQCAMKMSRETRIRVGDNDEVAFLMGQEPNPDLRAWLFEQLLHVGTSDLIVMLNQSAPLALWTGLIGILMMRQVHQVTYAIDAHTIRPVSTPITAWLLPATSRVGIRMGEHSWSSSLEASDLLDLAYVVLQHGDNTRVLIDQFT